MSYRNCLYALIVGLMSTVVAWAQTPQPTAEFDGLNMNLGNLPRLSNAQSRSISAENFTGEKGRGAMATEGTGQNAARELGQGWKVSPSVVIKAKSTFTLAEIDGSGAIQQIWMTPSPLAKTRLFILRFYWDDEEEPSVEVPMGDFFASGWGQYCLVNSLPVCVNPGSAFNCYWNMPFRKKAKITLENLDDNQMRLYYQINYTLTDVPKDAAYFHAQFRRVLKLPVKTDYTILDGVTGRGQYVGTYMAWEARSPGWWGEGEIKFFIDGDDKFPTICGTGTEDYFCGSYGFHNPETRRYQIFSTPFAGMPQVLPPDVVGLVGQRFGLYRWHVVDPVRFQKDLRVTMQALGWQSEGRYLPLQDDIASVAYWYQTEPHAKFPPLPAKDELTIKPLAVERPAEKAEQEAGVFLRARKIKDREAYMVIVEPPDNRITSLNLKCNPIDDEVLEQVSKLYRLTTLIADKCNITDDQLKHLSGLTELTNLILSRTPVSDEGLAHIRSLSNLQSLYLNGTAVTNRGLDHLAGLDNLMILNLSGTKVDDEGIKKLLALKKLAWLLLSDTEITDACLDSMAAMNKLGRLTILNTKVTPEGVAKLKQAKPRMHVDYRRGE